MTASFVQERRCHDYKCVYLTARKLFNPLHPNITMHILCTDLSNNFNNDNDNNNNNNNNNNYYYWNIFSNSDDDDDNDNNYDYVISLFWNLSESSIKDE